MSVFVCVCVMITWKENTSEKAINEFWWHFWHFGS